MRRIGLFPVLAFSAMSLFAAEAKGDHHEDCAIGEAAPKQVEYKSCASELTVEVSAPLTVGNVSVTKGSSYSISGRKVDDVDYPCCCFDLNFSAELDFTDKFDFVPDRSWLNWSGIRYNPSLPVG